MTPSVIARRNDEAIHHDTTSGLLRSARNDDPNQLPTPHS